MAITTLSASHITPRPWQNSSKLNPETGFEFSIDGLYGVCFDKSQFQYVGVTQGLAADLYPTVLPADLKLVQNPYGGTEKDYTEAGFKKVLHSTEDISVYLTDGFQDPGQAHAVVKRQIEDFIITDPCCVDDVDSHSSSNDKKGEFGQTKKLTYGGRVCSKPIYRSTDSAPVTFHLKMDKVWGDFSSPHPELLPDGQLDHFLIPSKAPNKSTIWLAFPRLADPVENKRNLEAWDKNKVRYAGFSGILITSDALKITITLDANPT